MDSPAAESSRPPRRSRLARARADAGYSQDAFAATVHVSRSAVFRWERGEGGLPFPRTVHRIGSVLGLTPAEVEALFADTEEQPVNQSVVAPAAGGQFDLPRTPMSSGTAGPFTGRAIGRDQLDGMGKAILDIVQNYEQTGPTVMGGRALELRRQAVTWLDMSPRIHEQTELYRYAAQIGGLLAYMAVNVGRFRLADAYCGEALHLAYEANDVDLQMWLRGTQAHCAYYEGNYELAIASARAGHEIAHGNAQSIRLLVNGEARAQAKLGRRKEAERAVGRAMDLLDQRRTDPGLTPCISFEPYGYSRLAANAATAHVAAGDVNRVVGLTKGLDGEVDSLDSVWSRALMSLDVATTLLVADKPDLDEAMRLGQRAMEACGDRPIRSVWQRALELRRLSEQWDQQPAVADFQEAFKAFSATEATLAVASSAA